MAIGKEGDLCTLAIDGRQLPARIGLDWSFPPAWAVAEKRGNETLLDTFLRVAKWGSVVSYDPIGPDVLRVQTKDADASKPATWPSLSAVGREEIVTFTHMV